MKNLLRRVIIETAVMLMCAFIATYFIFIIPTSDITYFTTASGILFLLLWAFVIVFFMFEDVSEYTYYWKLNRVNRKMDKGRLLYLATICDDRGYHQWDHCKGSVHECQTCFKLSSL